MPMPPPHYCEAHNAWFGKECGFCVETSELLKKARVESGKSYMPEDIELEARKLVRTGQREAAYGEPGKDFKRTAAMWTGYLRDKLKADITPEDVAIMQILLKCSRLAETPHHHDSKVDTIGYMICYDRLEKK